MDNWTWLAALMNVGLGLSVCFENISVSERGVLFLSERHRSASRVSSGSDVAAEYDVSKRINRSKDLKVDYRKMFAAMIYAQARQQRGSVVV